MPRPPIHHCDSNLADFAREKQMQIEQGRRAFRHSFSCTSLSTLMIFGSILELWLQCCEIVFLMKTSTISDLYKFSNETLTFKVRKLSNCIRWYSDVQRVFEGSLKPNHQNVQL